jgi:FtsZ-binding cell division protein ZapB
MGIPILSEIERLINEHGSAVILKERLALAADQYSSLQKQVVQLQSENERLRLDHEECQKQRRALEEELSHIASQQEWTEEAGALFKRNADGSWNETPYCPSCKTAMVSPGRHELFRCSKKSCGQFASFKGIGLGDVICRLPS